MTRLMELSGRHFCTVLSPREKQLGEAFEPVPWQTDRCGITSTKPDTKFYARGFQVQKWRLLLRTFGHGRVNWLMGLAGTTHGNLRCKNTTMRSRLASNIKPEHWYHVDVYTLPFCDAVTWSRAIRRSGVLQRDLLLIKWSIFPGRDPPHLCFRHQNMNAARLLLLLELTGHAGRRGEKPVLSGLQLAPELDKFCCGVLLSVSLCPSHSISPTPPSHLSALLLLLLLLLPPPPPALPPSEARSRDVMCAWRRF